MADEDETFYALQRLPSESLHALGDLLLPWLLGGLVGLKKHGLNNEGKTRKGTPDSFVGRSPADCRAAVEYTTQDEDLAGKFASDYRSVRTHCAKATTVVLCTNRSTDGVDLQPLRAQASADQITLHFVDGRTIAATLRGPRQDLRQLFLGIPVNVHTLTSLVITLRERLDDISRGRVEPQALDAFVPRANAERTLRDAMRGNASAMFLIVAPAGAGKTTWSFEHAKRHAGVEPVVWLPAVELPSGQTDPISLAIVQTAFGAPDPQRVGELAQLLHREGKVLRLVLDAVDETRDYTELARCLKAFRISQLAKATNVLLTCRAAALPLLEQELRPTFPELFRTTGTTSASPNRTIRLPELDGEQAQTLLKKAGATDGEARHVKEALPRKFQGNPLFLLRGLQLAKGSVSTPGGQATMAWVEAFAAHFVRDIARRLRVAGRGPSEATIQSFLEGVAREVLDSASGTITADRLPQGSSFDGENTPLQRAIQVGLLVQRGPGIGFAHAIFFEHFATRALAPEGDFATLFDRLRNNPSHEILVSLVMRHPAPLDALRIVARDEPIAACKIAARLGEIGDAQLRKRLVEGATTLMAGRFLSVQAQGLRLLQKLHWPESRQAAVEWFNALSDTGKTRWRHEAADLFLSLHVPEAFHVILWHWELAFDWYEPSFVARASTLPAAFASALRASARKALETDEAPHASTRRRLVKLLATLGDPWLVRYLAARLETELLDENDHRALIHLNTEESILLYAESVERCWEHEERNSTPGDTHHQYMLKGGDILMLDHNKLTELVSDALTNTSGRRAAFATEWATFLGDEALLPAYYAAMRRFRGWWGAYRGDLVRNIVKNTGAAEAIAMYHRYDEAVQADIVHCLDQVPGPEAEAFLCERLSEKRHQFSAAQALGMMGAINAGPPIHELLFSDDDHVREMAARALGTLRHVPAVQDLASALKAGSYSAIESLGKIGTLTAYEALGQHFSDALNERRQQQILRALVRRRDREGLDVAKGLVDRWESAKGLIADAVGHPKFLERSNAWESIEPLLTYDALCIDVVAAARRVLMTGSPSGLDFSLRGVACFDHPTALGFLEEVANGQLRLASTDGYRTDTELRNEAKLLLALRGRAPYQRQVIDEEFDRLETDQAPWSVDRLRRWPVTTVRKELLNRIALGERLYRWLTLLQWFATADDNELFRQFERHEDVEIASLCHEHLRSHNSAG
jgi:HEAT repeat protein